MAIYHFDLKINSRGKGKSAVAAAAYRAGELIKNEYDGVEHDYRRKHGVVHTEIILPQNAPAEFADRATLWNSVEMSERYKTAQLAREIEVALPKELTREQQIALARRYANEVYVSRGMCADVAIHDKDDGNPHCHILLTMRPIEKDGSWGAKSKTINGRKINSVDWNDRDKCEEWRKAWAAYANGAMRLAGLLTEDNVLDHRSYKRQGIDKTPTVHLGPAASQMEKRGIRTERGDINRAIEISNAELRQTKARIKRLQAWLEQEQKTEPPTFFDIISAKLANPEDKTFSQKLIDLKAAAKVQMFMERNGLATLADLRGKVGEYLDEQSDLSEKLKPFERRIKTLDEHLRHCDNFTKYRKFAEKRDALFAEAHRLDTQNLIFKGKAKEALEKAERYEWDNLNAIRDYEAAEKYLKGVLQKRFDPKKIPVAKWRQERDDLAREKGGLNTQFAVLKNEIREVEVIRKTAEDIARALNPQERNRQSHGFDL